MLLLAAATCYTKARMRRALASLLIALFSLTALTPLFAVEQSSELPACCRRAGKHHCEMDAARTSGGPGLHSNCALFPKGHCSGSVACAAACDLPVAASSVPVTSASVRTGARTYFVTAFSESTPKRGPPSSC